MGIHSRATRTIDIRMKRNGGCQVLLYLDAFVKPANVDEFMITQLKRRKVDHVPAKKV